MDNAFLDTNIIIANIFEINSNHIKSKKVFNDYSKFFCSLNVKNELKRRFPIKKQNLLKFFLDLSIELNNPKQEFFTVLDLNRFANGSFSEKQKNDVESFLMPFWNHYIGIESIVSVQNILNGINNCLFDLNVFLAVNKKNLEKLLILTPKRTKKYSDIDNLLKSEGVKDADRLVTLDGHDFACNSSDPIDFVTFDVKLPRLVEVVDFVEFFCRIHWFNRLRHLILSTLSKNVYRYRGIFNPSSLLYGK